MKILFSSASLCPVCKKRIPATYLQYDQVVKMKKICPEHGTYLTDIWRGEHFLDWCKEWRPEPERTGNCPNACGLCEEHLTKTCCALLDITTQCNLHCSFCFADGGKGAHMPLEKVKEALDDMYEKGLRFIHISGGEPTVHPDLLEIIRYASEKGFMYIQLNTNGLKIAEDAAYAKKLQKVGTSCVFLQFDGVTEDVYRKIRGKALLEIKKQAIVNCDRAELGVVLVPTVIAGINDHELGAIIRFAYDNMPAIRGVHIQPVTYVGRYDQGEHLTIPEILSAIETQTDGLIKKEQLLPSACDTPLCGFHGEFRKEEDGLIPLSDGGSCCCGGSGDAVVKNQLHVKNRWTRIPDGDYEETSFMAQMKKMSDQSFCVSGMMFQDLSNIDLGRVRGCSVHVYKDGKLTPFCVYHSLSE